MPDTDYGAQDRDANRAFRDAARRAYGSGGRAAGGGKLGDAAEALRRLREAMGAPVDSQVPAEVRGRVVIVGKSPAADVRITGDPFAGQHHARLTQVHAPGSAAHDTVWVEPLDPGRAVNVRRPDGSLVRVELAPVRVRPGDVLVCGTTEIPWRRG